MTTEASSISERHSGHNGSAAVVPIDVLDYVDKIESRCEKLVQHESALRALEVSAAKMALELAQQENDRRFGQANRLREQIESERGQFVERTYFERLHGLLEERTRELERVQANLAGRYLVAGAVLGAVMGAVMGAVTVYVTKR